MNNDSLKLPLAVRGFARDAVEAVIAGLHAEIDSLQTALSKTYPKEEVDRLASELKIARQLASESEQKYLELAEDTRRISSADGNRDMTNFEEILRVAEEQADQLSANAVAQAERLISEVRDENAKVLEDARRASGRLISDAEYKAEQVELRAETEATAKIQIAEDRVRFVEEQVVQAEQEAALIVCEAERLAAAARTQATQDAAEMRESAARILDDAQTAVSEINLANQRKLDEAQREFLRMHNDAVAHAQRITEDANEAVTSALDRANHIQSQNALSEELAKTQVDQQLAESKYLADEIMNAAKTRASALIEKVRDHVKALMRDAEDRSRTLRHQNQQLRSFISEIEPLLEFTNSPLEQVVETTFDSAVVSYDGSNQRLD